MDNKLVVVVVFFDILFFFNPGGEGGEMIAGERKNPRSPHPRYENLPT